MDDNAIGQVVDGYRIQRIIGRGGMGVVYEAEDVALSRPVAIKRVNPSQANRDIFLHRFRSEARALARIDSPHIVSVYALRDTDLGLLIVMEYVDGGTLEDRIESGPMALDEALPLLKQMLQAFGDAHSAGVIHRDIKPQNIMLTQDGMVKVTDFGIAKMRTQDTGKTVTQGGQGGTLKYMSPEQISDIQAVDDTSDIYALGMVTYQMLVGQLPFGDAETDFDIMRKVVEGKLPSPTEYKSDLPAPLVELIVTATAKQQKDRYQTTEEMMAVIESFEQEAEVNTQNGTQPKQPTGQAAPPPEFKVDDMPETPPDGATVLAASNEEEATATQTRLASPESSPSGDARSGDPAGNADRDAEPADHSSSRLPLIGGAVVAFLLLIGGTWWLMGSGAGTGSLSIATDPSEAVVYVDDDSVGVTPLRDYTLQAGLVQVRVVKEGYTPLDTTLEIAANRPQRIDELVLTEGQVRFVIDTTPRDARVFVDGEAIGTTPFDSEVLIAAGTRHIRIEKEGYEPHDTTLTAESAGSSLRLSANLRPDPEQDAGTGAPSSPSATAGGGQEQATAAEVAASAMITVNAQPGGTVTVDGQSSPDGGQFEVGAGTRRVECTHPEYGSVATSVTVTPGQREALQCFFEHPVTINSDPWGSVWINSERTNRTTNEMRSVYFEPGIYEIQVRIDRQDRILSGGNVSIMRGDEQERQLFSGYTFTIEVEPSFVETEYFITFTD